MSKKKEGENVRLYLKKLREEKGLTQQETAAKMGMRANYYSMFESGSRQADMNLSIAEKLAEVFGVEISWIIEEENKLK